MAEDGSFAKLLDAAKAIQKLWELIPGGMRTVAVSAVLAWITRAQLLWSWSVVVIAALSFIAIATLIQAYLRDRVKKKLLCWPVVWSEVPGPVPRGIQTIGFMITNHSSAELKNVNAKISIFDSMTGRHLSIIPFGEWSGLDSLTADFPVGHSHNIAVASKNTVQDGVTFRARQKLDQFARSVHPLYMTDIDVPWHETAVFIREEKHFMISLLLIGPGVYEKSRFVLHNEYPPHWEKAPSRIRMSVRKFLLGRMSKSGPSPPTGQAKS